jgi:hypothetical protein
MAGLLFSGLAGVPSDAAEQTQTLNLGVGWHAVWLEVSPVDANGAPEAVTNVFTDSNITLVAGPQAAVSSAEFVTNPDADSLARAGWAVWRRASEIQEHTLASVQGNQGYLIKVENAPVSQAVTGEVRFFRPNWQAGGYTLVGFSFTQADAVTFADFFAASDGAHPSDSIFRLDSSTGNWVGATISDYMQPGEAYWVFATRASTYAGPVAIGFNGIGELNFGSTPGTVGIQNPQDIATTIYLSRTELVFSNLDAQEHTFGIRKLIPATTNAAATVDRLRLFDVVPDGDLMNYDISGQIGSWSGGSITSAVTEIVTLGAHRNWDSGARDQENLYRVEVDNQYFWLPVRAENPDLPTGTVGSPAPQYAGLWVGQAVLDSVSSLTEPGSPKRDTTTYLPMQLVIHVDTNGVPSLLSHVMVMQTKTADSSIAPEVVLVVNEEKIPFFEGIEERGGKQVGRRIETVSFDMPRMFDVATQSNLLDEVAAAFSTNVNDVTESNIVVYVNSRNSRPPGLVEAYHQTWAMDGGVAPGNAIQTSPDKPLAQDPFHRSNPFRHAFHTRHGAGFALQRTIRLAFDADYEAGKLTGVYEESAEGLAAMPIRAEGRFMLERVSDVGGLQ